MAPLSFVLWIMAKLLCPWLCLLDAVVELLGMDVKVLNDFLI